MHKAVTNLKADDRQRRDSGLILRLPSSGHLCPSRRISHVRSSSAPHAQVFSSSSNVVPASNWADEMDQWDQQREGSMRAKKLKELIDDRSTSEKSILAHLRTQLPLVDAPVIIAIPGSQFVEEADAGGRPARSARSRAPQDGKGSPRRGNKSPKNSTSPPPSSSPSHKEKGRAARSRVTPPSSPPSLPRIQTGLSARGPQLPPDYREEDVVRDWNEPIEGLPLPLEDELKHPPPPNTHVEVAHDPYSANGQRMFLVPDQRQTSIDFMKLQLGDPKVRVFMAEYEDDLTAVTIQFLEDSSINPYRGSVPVERIQNVVRTKCPDLYSKVVGRSHGSWKKYVEKHDDVFQLFSVEEGKWRMRLIRHSDYKVGDQQEVAARLAWEAHFTQTLITLLHARPGCVCKVDEFMAQYPGLPDNPRTPEGALEFALPPRGDLVRFVKRHAQYFTYDQSLFLIGLKPNV